MESASRNLVLEWDAFSGWGFKRKVHPGIRAWNGTHFPEQPSTGNCDPESTLGTGYAFRNGLQAEIASRSEPSFRDTVSARYAIWKAHPILRTQSEIWFPRCRQLESVPQFDGQAGISSTAPTGPPR